MQAETAFYRIALEGDVIRIIRKAGVANAESVRSLPLSVVTGAEFRGATTYSPGALTILHSGTRSSLFGSISAFSKDSVEFPPADQPAFRQVYHEVMRRVVGDGYVPEDTSAADEAIGQEAAATQKQNWSLIAWGCAGWAIIIVAALLFS